MSSSAETLYTFRSIGPDVLQRARTQTVQMEAYRDGQLVAPTVSGSSFSLLDPSGTAIVDAQAITVVGSVAQFTIPDTSLPATLALGLDYSERWVLVMPDGTIRTVTREAGVARSLLHPVVADVDLTAGEYPDLLAELETLTTTLQGFIDEAWIRILEKLFQRERWPDLLISSSALRRPHAELALHLVFKMLFRAQPASTRWERLMTLHLSNFEQEWAAWNGKWDRDQDGLADGPGREAAGVGIVHRHVGPRANHDRLGARWRQLC